MLEIATQDGCKSLIIKANDIDVVIIAVSVLPSLQQLGLQSMWIDFGQGANARWIPVHELLSAIGPEKASGILYFHSFTGCDVVSAFHEKWKKSAWLTWDVHEKVSETFTRLSRCPTVVSDAEPETFVVLMYNISSASSGGDEVRLDLFARKQRAYMMQFHQPELLSRSMQDVLPTKLGSSGDSQLSLTQRSAVQPTGGGLRLERRGRYVGQLFHLLRQAVSG